MDRSSLMLLGWKPFFENQLSAFENAHSIPARIGAHFGSRLLLLLSQGDLELPIQLASREVGLAVGDWVLLESARGGVVSGESDEYRIARRLERFTELTRKAAGTGIERQPIAANVDTLFVVGSCNQEFNLSRLERYLALALEAGATPVIVLTKADLGGDVDQLRREAERLHGGLLVETLDARDTQQCAVLQGWCEAGKTVALLGSSGVGKSTLVNSLGVAINQATGGIRTDDDKGRHTTTTRSLHQIPTGGWLLDTPGMRELQLAGCEDGLTELFADVFAYVSHCRFRNCSHRGDEGCAVTAAVESGELDGRRVRNYLKLQSEQARNAQSLMERRQTDKKFGRMCKSIMANKRKTRDLS